MTQILVGIPLAVLGIVLAVLGATRTIHNTFTGAPIYAPDWTQFAVGLVLALVGLVVLALGVLAVARHQEATRPLTSRS